VVAAAVYLLLPPRPTREVAVPADNATPEQVVRAYLDALDAHDCRTAEALVTAGTGDTAKTWCADVAHLTDVHIEEHVRQRPEDSGIPANAEVVYVPVSFNVSWRRFHNDGSMDEGATTWGYLLTHPSSNSPWRIFDQGVG
jgi:hypothetical protein